MNTPRQPQVVLALLVVTLAVIHSLAFLVLPTTDSYAQQEGGYTPAPDRPGGDRDNWCPPNGKFNQTGPPTRDEPNDPRDKDVDNADGDNDPATGKDYYMGEYKFVEGDNDLIVRIWCIRTPLGEVFTDYFTHEIITSFRGEETVRVAPGAPI